MLGDHSCCHGWPGHHPRPSVISQSSGLVLRSLLITSFTISLPGWGATDRSVEQSRYPRQVDLTLNTTRDCNCSSIYFLETNVGPDGEDTCEGDSGQTERSRDPVEMSQ